MKEELYWQTKEGKIIPVSQMEDSHLINAISFLKRECKAGEEYLDIHNGYDGIYRFTKQENLKENGYYKLLAEKRRRKLTN